MALDCDEEVKMAGLARWWASTPTGELIWIAIGLVAQSMFFMRFIVQWIASEKIRASTIPEAFWYFSLMGGLLLLAYSVYRLDLVFIVGQAVAVVIYFRNIYFIWLGKRVPSPTKAA